MAIICITKAELVNGNKCNYELLNHAPKNLTLPYVFAYKTHTVPI